MLLFASTLHLYDYLYQQQQCLIGTADDVSKSERSVTTPFQNIDFWKCLTTETARKLVRFSEWCPNDVHHD